MKQGFFSGVCSFVLFTICSLSLSAQSAKDVFNSQTPIFYYGIDFTKAKLINDAEANEHDIKDRQFDGINDLIVNEAKKYDIASALRRSELPNDLGYVAKRNATVSIYMADFICRYFIVAKIIENKEFVRYKKAYNISATCFCMFSEILSIGRSLESVPKGSSISSAISSRLAST